MSAFIRIFHGIRAFSSDLIDLCNNRIEYLAFEWSEYDCFIFDRVNDKSLSWLDNTRSNAIDCCDSYNESIFARTRTLHFSI